MLEKPFTVTLDEAVEVMKAEKESGNYTEDWNKVVLIPVETEVDSSGNIIGVKNNLQMQSASLVGGESSPIEMQVLFTTF